ncbi:MAG: hypothetical protein ACYC7D_14565 [Nitrososphaerales archaeon]
MESNTQPRITPISECETCADLSDKAFEASQPALMGGRASKF